MAYQKNKDYYMVRIRENFQCDDSYVLDLILNELSEEHVKFIHETLVARKRQKIMSDEGN